mgnify:CR=1 FL=1
MRSVKASYFRVSRRSGRVCRRGEGHARRSGRGHSLSAQPSRHRGPAGRGDGFDGRMGGRSTLATIRSAAPFAELSRSVFEGVLDMLSGRYPSDEFAELRPRVVGPHREAPSRHAREPSVAIANGGTIARSGALWCLSSSALMFRNRRPEPQGRQNSTREMVFESRIGETLC